MIFLSFSH